MNSAPTPDTEIRASERGSATVEFTLLATMLLVPVIYFLIMIAQLQAAGYAAVAAADQIARVMAHSATNAQGFARADAITDQVMTDYGLDPDLADIDISCTHTPCASPGARITVTATATIGLPLVPTVFGVQTRVASSSATSTQQVGLHD